MHITLHIRMQMHTDAFAHTLTYTTRMDITMKIYVYVCVFEYVNESVHDYMCMYTYVCACARIIKYMCICVYSVLHIFLHRTHTIHTHVPTHRHTHIHTQHKTRTYTHTHTHTKDLLSLSKWMTRKALREKPPEPFTKPRTTPPQNEPVSVTKTGSAFQKPDPLFENRNDAFTKRDPLIINQIHFRRNRPAFRKSATTYQAKF
mgnify:CR=1 FL=1